MADGAAGDAHCKAGIGACLSCGSCVAAELTVSSCLFLLEVVGKHFGDDAVHPHTSLELY